MLPTLHSNMANPAMQQPFFRAGRSQKNKVHKPKRAIYNQLTYRLWGTVSTAYPHKRFSIDFELTPLVLLSIFFLFIQK